MKYSHDDLIYSCFTALTLRLLVLFNSDIAKMEFSILGDEKRFEDKFKILGDLRRRDNPE